MTENQLTLTDDSVLACPFDAYKTLRDEYPVYKDPVSGFFIVSRFADIKAITEQHDIFSNDTGALADGAFHMKDKAAEIMKAKACPHVNTLVTADPPDHSKYRSLVDQAFRISRIEKLTSYIEGVARDLIAGFENAGKAEILSALAIPMPMYIIADQLGVPRDRYLEFKTWSDALLMIADRRLPEDVRVNCANSVVAMQRYLDEKANEYRRTPADNIFSDVANSKIDGRLLTSEEVVSIASQLLVAGNETTTNTMAMGLQLMINGGYEEKLRAEPALIPRFVEEVLRLTTAIQGMFRRAKVDTELHGVSIPAGTVLMLRWAAGNRDERRFQNADLLDLSRKDASAHLAFGHGVHFCLGNVLARRELNIAYKVLLERLQNFRIADEPDAEKWVIHAFARGMSRLSVTFDRV